jgi:anti-anti-sigma regulatory factor
MANQVKIPEDFFIGNVAEVASEILFALQGGEEVVIDLGTVNRIDTAAIQAVLSAKKEAESLGVNLTIIQTDFVRDFVATIGVVL